MDAAALAALQLRVDRAELAMQLYLKASRKPGSGGDAMSSAEDGRTDGEVLLTTLVERAKSRVQGDVDALQRELERARDRHQQLCMQVSGLEGSVGIRPSATPGSGPGAGVLATQKALKQVGRVAWRGGGVGPSLLGCSDAYGLSLLVRC